MADGTDSGVMGMEAGDAGASGGGAAGGASGRRRRAGLATLGAVLLAVYLVIGRIPRADALVLVMPDWVPFLPALTIPYLALLGAGWFLPLAIADERRFRTCLVALVVAYLLVAPWWLITPSVLPRPALPLAWWDLPYRLLVAIDAPTNVLPCAHAVGPVVTAWFLGRDRPGWRWWLAAMLVAGLPTIACTWQHRPVDILLGVLAGVVAIGVATALAMRCASAAPRR